MRVDVFGAIELVRRATEFNWLWDLGNVEQFCVESGWRQIESEANVDSWKTNLDIDSDIAKLYKRVDPPSVLFIRVTVADTPSVGEVRSDSFTDLSRNLVTVLGRPHRFSPGADPRVDWDLDRLYIYMDCIGSAVNIYLMNPEFKEALDSAAADEKIDAEMLQSYESSVRRTLGSVKNWEHFKNMLAKILWRMPRHGVVVLNATGGRFMQFSFADHQLDGFNLVAEVSSNADIADGYRMSMGVNERMIEANWKFEDPSCDGNWSKKFQWPLYFGTFEKIANDAVVTLRELLAIDSPNVVEVEAWVEWPYLPFDTSTLGTDPHFK